MVTAADVDETATHMTLTAVSYGRVNGLLSPDDDEDLSIVSVPWR